MKNLLVLAILSLCVSCDQSSTGNSKDVVTDKKDSIKHNTLDVEAIKEELKNQGYQTFSYKEGDTTYLMQQYYMVLLKSGPVRDQDSIQAADLQKEHMEHLERMAKAGYTSLTGPIGDNGDIRGIVVYNTATQAKADSLARLDPMVQAGRLQVEVHPWWVAKGSKLK